MYVFVRKTNQASWLFLRWWTYIGIIIINLLSNSKSGNLKLGRRLNLWLISRLEIIKSYMDTCITEKILRTN